MRDFVWFDFIIKNVMPKLCIYNSEIAVNNANTYITTLRYELTQFDEIPEEIKKTDIINETILDYITYIFWKDYRMHIPHIIHA